MPRKHVLFLCTGNSCRSQMAEGLVNQLWGDTWRAYSAGTRPSGYVHPLAIEAMAELGIDIGRNESQSAETVRDIPFDRVFTVCDNAAQDCPVWLGPGVVTHTPFPDPADATGSHEERMAVFRAVRDDLRAMLSRQLGPQPDPY